MLKNLKYMIAAGALMMFGCTADGDHPGYEYAPQMYHSVAYEPLSQFGEEDVPSGTPWSIYPNSVPVNDFGVNPAPNKRMNMLTPVEGTVKRQMHSHDSLKGKTFFYEIHKDSLDLAARILKNPLPAGDEKVLAQGKELYLSYCAPCHGETGEGDGSVGKVFKGVPTYKSGRVKTVSEGHIFHVITHGKGRMWPHKTQLNPEERWKVVRYVQQLQSGQ
jgi:hypothetical protein